jgi:glycosyltransferase involved in cell wall biosynthesis
LPDLLAALKEELPKITSAYEIILINDGSTDNSWVVVINLVGKKKNVIGINPHA